MRVFTAANRLLYFSLIQRRSVAGVGFNTSAPALWNASRLHRTAPSNPRVHPLTVRVQAMTGGQLTNGNKPQKVLIVGGVAGGASCAARLRRLSEDAEIIVFERGPYVSFANCGLPYYVGDVIQEEAKLVVANVAKFRNWFNIEVKESTEVVSIDREAKKITAKNLTTGEESQHEYDALVLSPGAQAIRPPLPGIDLPGIFQMKTIPDSNAVKSWIAKNDVKTAVVVGAGFIGLEMVENLVHLGIKTSVVEMLPQVMPPLDAEMVSPVHDHLRSKGVNLFLGDGVAGFEAGEGGKGLTVMTQSGKRHPADLVMLVIGVRPDVALAKSCGLQLGARGGISVDGQQQTSDPAIYAVGDAVEVRDWVTGELTLCPLAGPANRQGRIAADAIMGSEPSIFRGVQATAVVGVFGMTVASTGASEKTLKRVGMPYDKVYLHVNNHAGYYPGAAQIDMKLLFDPKDGKILGLQAVGLAEGVEKRVDVVAAMMQMRGTVFDLEEAELCYAPQYGSAKDPVNMIGMVASNVVRGDLPIVNWDSLNWEELSSDPNALILDVREPGELERLGQVSGAVNMPLSSFRKKLQELPQDKDIYVYCQVGQRGYYATRQLLLSGYKAINVTGGFKSYTQFGEKVQGAKL